jgi:transcriptional regulator with XRE-family HTH domain
MSQPTLTAAAMVLDLLESGHTQHEIAAVCDVHQTTISKIARGDTADMLGRAYAALTALHASSFKPTDEVKHG